MTLLLKCCFYSAKLSLDRWSVEVGRRHPVTMRKAPYKTLSMRRVLTLPHQAGAQYSAVE